MAQRGGEKGKNEKGRGGKDEECLDARPRPANTDAGKLGRAAKAVRGEPKVAVSSKAASVVAQRVTVGVAGAGGAVDVFFWCCPSADVTRPWWDFSRPSCAAPGTGQSRAEKGKPKKKKKKGR